MASRELQPLKSASVVLDEVGISRSSSASANDGSASGMPFVLVALQRRWWLFGMCLVVGGAVAYFVANENGQTTAECSGSLIYTGLPAPPGVNVYSPPSLMTYRDILFSTPNMKRVCERNGLGVPPAALAKFFEPSVSGYSSIMSIHLNWADAEDSVAILNDTMELLIDQAAEHRKKTLREAMKHVELGQLEAKDEVDRAAEELSSAKSRRNEFLGTDALKGGEYSSALQRVTNTEAAIDALQLKQLGVTQQMEWIDAKAKDILTQLHKNHVNVRVDAVRKLLTPYEKGSEPWLDLRDVASKIDIIAKGEPPALAEYMNWKAALTKIGQGVLPPAEQLETPEIQRLEGDLRTHLANREKLEMELISRKTEMSWLETRLQQYEEQAKKLADNISGVTGDELEAFDKKLAVAQGRLQLIDQQLRNMRQLAESSSTEFEVLMPASMETTQIKSNKKKLFVLTFFAVSMMLCAPVLASEWLRQRASPVARFAGRWGLPVIAERLLASYSPSNRKPAERLLEDAIRMTTLRIQQSLQQSGGVVLVSGLGNTPTPVKMMSAIAECLAQREEKVLLVDAMDPTFGKSSLSPAAASFEQRAAGQQLTVGKNPPSREGEGKPRKMFGLSEYLARECEGITDLIQPTACPGVDLISSGSGKFPREAMASSCITELFDHCRNSYSIILVAGPPAVARADFQMLAARADAILLAADRASIGNPVSRAVVQDLIELRAPIVGIVA